MDTILVENGRVARVWHGHTPKGVAGQTFTVPDGVAVPGMLYAGGVLSHAPLVVRPHDVKAECQTRILDAYPLARQQALTMDGGADYDEMVAEITRLRLLSRQICRMRPIPQDFRDDNHWTGNPLRDGLAGAAPGATQPQSALGGQYAPASAGGPAASVFSPTIHIAPAAVNVTNTACTGPSSGSGGGTETVATPAGAGGTAAPEAPSWVVASGAPELPPLPNVDPPEAAMSKIAIAAPVAGQGGGVEQHRRSAADAINSALADVIANLWPATKEVAAENAARAMKGNDAAFELIAPRAEAAGQPVAEYCDAVLTERVYAHKTILALDNARDLAIEALALAGSPEDVDRVVAEATQAINRLVAK